MRRSQRSTSPVNDVPTEIDVEFPPELDMDMTEEKVEHSVDMSFGNRLDNSVDMTLDNSVDMSLGNRLDNSVDMTLEACVHDLQLDDDAVFDMEPTDTEWKIDQVPVSELSFLQQQVQRMYKTVHMCKLNRLHLMPVSQASDWKEEWTTRIPEFSWQTMQDLLYADPKKPACCHEANCKGITSKLDSVYWSPDGNVFEGSVLSAYNGPGTPCLLCLLHQTHHTVFLFLINRLPLRSLPPFQLFFNTDLDFHSEMLQKPDNAMFNGLVAPIMMFIHDKMMWDFDKAKQQWFVNIGLFRKPEVVPGVQVSVEQRDKHMHLKQPKKF